MAVQTVSSPKKNIKFDRIQVLRGIAALLVVFAHMCNAESTFHPYNGILSTPFFHQMGAVGVDVFFVISGFIMYYTNAGKTWSFDTGKTFLLKRIERIYPLYWIFTTVFLILIIGGLGSKNSPITLFYTISSYLLIPSFKPGNSSSFHPILDQGWTLSFEMYFYLVFTLGIMFKQQSRVLIFLAVSFLVLAAAGILFYDVYPPLTQLMTSPLIIEFILGVLVAKVLLSLKEKFFSSFYAGFSVNILVICFGFLLLLFSNNLIKNVPLRPLMRYPLASLIVFSGAILPRLTSWFGRMMIYLGNASYSIYLTHSLLSKTLGMLLKKGYLHQFSPNVIIITFTTGTIAVCSLAYLFIEKPLTERIRKLTLPKKELHPDRPL